MQIDELKALTEKIKSEPASVTADELDAARDAIRAQVEETKGQDPSEEVIALLETLVAAKAAVDGETTARAETAAAQAAKSAELLAELNREPEPETPADEPKGDDAGENDAPTENEDPAQAAENEDTVTEQTPELIAASGAIGDAIAKGIEKAFAAREAKPAVEAPKGRSGRPGAVPTPEQVRPGHEVATLRVFAGKDAASSAINDNADLVSAFHDAYKGAYQTKGFNGRITVAHAETTFPESRILGSDPIANFRKLDAVTSPSSLVAAGGLCAPLETDYTVDTIGSAARPLRDALARFTTERGGVTFRGNYSAADAMAGSGIWTMANDEAADDPNDSGAPTKAVGIVDCPGMESAEVYAVYNRLQFSNVTTRFDPESTQANIKLSQVAHARLAENTLYAAIAAKTKLVYAPTQVAGAVRHSLVQLDEIVAYLRNRHRLDENVSLTWVAPLWVKNLFRSDIALQMAAGDWQDALGLADNILEGFFTRRGVNPVWFLDGSTASATVNSQTIPAQTYPNVTAGSVVPVYPAKIDSLLFETGSMTFLDGGTLDLGLVRDSMLNARNRYETFVESWEGVMDRGIESLRLLLDVNPTGGASGTVAIAVS